jgi:hypothetical protein
MDVIYYDHHFNMNEWFILISVVVGAILVIKVPKRFSKKTTLLYLLCGVFTGFFFDHVLSVLPVSYYDINDNSTFEVMDFFSHFMYAPVSYFFFYLYNMFHIKPTVTPIYILVWVFVSIGIERFCVHIGIFHYSHGYNIYYSFAIYLVVISLWVFFYRTIEVNGEKQY